MKALFAQDWKGPLEFICRPPWCFPCPLKELDEEVNRPVHPETSAASHWRLQNKPALCSADGGDMKDPDPLVLTGSSQPDRLYRIKASSSDFGFFTVSLSVFIKMYWNSWIVIIDSSTTYFQGLNGWDAADVMLLTYPYPIFFLFSS